MFEHIASLFEYFAPEKKIPQVYPSHFRRINLNEFIEELSRVKNKLAFHTLRPLAGKPVTDEAQHGITIYVVGPHSYDKWRVLKWIYKNIVYSITVPDSPNTRLLVKDVNNLHSPKAVHTLRNLPNKIQLKEKIS